MDIRAVYSILSYSCKFVFLTGTKYYVNQFTKQSQWEVPTKPAERESSEKVQAKHLLVKHAESRRPSSWRQEVITRTKVKPVKPAFNAIQNPHLIFFQNSYSEKLAYRAKFILGNLFRTPFSSG